MFEEETRNTRRRTLVFGLGRNRGSTGILIESEQIGFVESDGAGVLPDVAGIVDSAGQFAEIARFDGVQMAHAESGGRGNGLQADALLLPPDFHAKYASIVHYRTGH